MTVKTRAIDLRTVLLPERHEGVHEQHEGATYILVSFAAEPPAIFCTRRVKSSFLSSVSCFDKSFLDLAYSIVSADIRKGWIQDALGLELVRLDLAGHFVVC